MKTNYFLSTLAICALTLVGCSSNNNEELNIKKNCKTGDVSADIPVTYEEISLSPEENELFLIEGIHDINHSRG